MATRIIVPERLRTTEALKQWICRKHHVLNLLNTAILASRNFSDVLHDPFRCFRLSCTRLPRNNNALVLMVGIHVIISAFGNAEDVWRDLESILPPILLECFLGVDAQIYSAVF